MTGAFDFLPPLPDPLDFQPEPLVQPFFDQGPLSQSHAALTAKPAEADEESCLAKASPAATRILELAMLCAAARAGCENVIHHGGLAGLLRAIVSETDLAIASRCLDQTGMQLCRTLVSSSPAGIAGREAWLDAVLDAASLEGFLLPEYSGLVASLQTRLLDQVAKTNGA